MKRFPGYIKESKTLFSLCEAFLDETEVPYKGKKHFILGGVLLPLNCSLRESLGNARIDTGYLGALRFSEISKDSRKERKAAKHFLDAFLKSNAVFRAIVVTPLTWQKTKNYKDYAKLAALMFCYPQMPWEDPRSGEIFRYNQFSRIRLVCDHLSLTKNQKEEFRKSFNGMLQRKNKITKTEDSHIIFSPRKIFDGLQLADLVLGVIRASYVLDGGLEVSKARRDLHDHFLQHFPRVDSFVAADRRNTHQRINVWHKS